MQGLVKIVYWKLNYESHRSKAYREDRRRSTAYRDLL